MAFKEPRSAFDRNPKLPPSRPASIFSAQSIDTLVADKSYRGFASEQAYLDALREWAEAKMFYETDEQLPGFYGHRTVDDILSKQGTPKSKKIRDQRRAMMAPRLSAVAEHNGNAAGLSRQNSATATTDAANASTEGRGSMLKKVFSRRKSAV